MSATDHNEPIDWDDRTADHALEHLGCPEGGILGDLGELISDLAQLADTHPGVDPAVIRALNTAVELGADFRDAARAAVEALYAAFGEEPPEPEPWHVVHHRPDCGGPFTCSCDTEEMSA